MCVGAGWLSTPQGGEGDDNKAVVTGAVQALGGGWAGKGICVGLARSCTGWRPDRTSGWVWGGHIRSGPRLVWIGAMQDAGGVTQGLWWAVWPCAQPGTTVGTVGTAQGLWWRSVVAARVHKGPNMHTVTCSAAVASLSPHTKHPFLLNTNRQHLARLACMQTANQVRAFHMPTGKQPNNAWPPQPPRSPARVSEAPVQQ